MGFVEDEAARFKKFSEMKEIRIDDETTLAPQEIFDFALLVVGMGEIGNDDLYLDDFSDDGKQFVARLARWRPDPTEYGRLLATLASLCRLIISKGERPEG